MSAQKTADKDTKVMPPYISYKTFQTCLDWLGEMPVLPTQIDRSLWGPKFSGSTGPQLLVALRFLGLLDGSKPTERLESLAHSKEERKALLLGVLRDSYGQGVMEEIPRMTPGLLDAKLKSLGTSDATLRKAYGFLVKACEDAGVTVPQSVKKRAKAKPGPKARNPRSGARNGREPKEGIEHKPPTQPKQSEQPENGLAVKTIQLESGGTVTITASLNPLTMSKSDRDWFFGLVDKFQEYRRADSPQADEDVTTP